MRNIRRYGNAATLGRIPLFLFVLENMPIGALVHSGLRESPGASKILLVCAGWIYYILFLFLSPSTQDLKFEGKGFSQNIPMSCLKKEKPFEKYVLKC